MLRLRTHGLTPGTSRRAREMRACLGLTADGGRTQLAAVATQQSCGVQRVGSVVGRAVRRMAGRRGFRTLNAQAHNAPLARPGQSSHALRHNDTAHGCNDGLDIEGLDDVSLCSRLVISGGSSALADNTRIGMFCSGATSSTRPGTPGHPVLAGRGPGSRRRANHAARSSERKSRLARGTRHNWPLPAPL